MKVYEVDVNPLGSYVTDRVSTIYDDILEMDPDGIVTSIEITVREITEDEYNSYEEFKGF